MAYFWIIVVILLILYFLFRKKKAPDTLPTVSHEKQPGQNLKRTSSHLNTKGNPDLKPKSEEIVGYHSSKRYSRNKQYLLAIDDGYSGKHGSIALAKDGALLFKVPLKKPEDCFVSNNGIVVCCDWTGSEDLKAKFMVFDSEGNLLFRKRASTNLGITAITDDGSIALFETYNPSQEGDNIVIVDVAYKKVANEFERPLSFNKVKFSEDNKTIRFTTPGNITYETDLTGKQVNKEQYREQILKRGTVIDKVQYFEAAKSTDSEEIQKYISLLNKALSDVDALDFFGPDKIYRKIGEQYEELGDEAKTIEFWDKAVQINPKVGVKRKLEQLRNKVSQ